MRNLGIILIIIVGFNVSCKKKTTENNDPNPTISFDRFTKTVITQFDDSVYLYINYTDGDGDLGEEDPDKKSLEIRDSRLPKADFYFIAPLAPKDANVKISGQLKIELKSLFLIGTGNIEVAAFDIRLRDRAGNWSNSIRTPEMTIRK